MRTAHGLPAEGSKQEFGPGLPPRDGAPAGSGCPPEDVLLALAEGGLDPHAVEALQPHLDECPDCFALLATMASPESGELNAHPKKTHDASSMPKEGDVLDGRYEVERIIGKGGMGIVIAAWDVALRRRIAIKLLPKLESSDSAVRKRLLREAHATAALAHPSIVRIHDVGQTEDDRVFVVMELVSGESLRALLRRGSIAPAQGIRLIVEVARALGAAHRGGVVHRDIKPDNIMIRDDGRAVVLDFGIAKLTQPGARSTKDPGVATTNLTVEGMILGTPAYMAPEQAEGGFVGVHTDQFALAVVAYEVLTGRLPWRGHNVATLIAEILRDAPAPPSVVRPGLPPALDVVLGRGMAKAPQDRYPDVDAFADALAKAEEQDASPIAPPIPRSSQLSRQLKPMAVWAGAGGLLLAGILAARNTLVSERAPASALPGASHDPIAAASNARPLVAVLGFRNASGAPTEGWLTTALEEMFTTDLASSDGLRVIPAGNVVRMRRELGLSVSETLGPDALAKIRLNLAVDIVVYGTFISLGEGANRKIRLDIRLQDAASTEMLALLAETGTEAELFDTIERASTQVRQRLGVEAASAADLAGARGAFPASIEATRLYTEGLDRIRRFDLPGAQEHLERAVLADPEHPLAHAALAAALARLGYEERAAAESKKAFDLSGKLGREARLVIEGQYREAVGEWDRSIQVYSTLFNFFSDDIEHGLRLVDAQTRADKRADAFATLETLRALPPPAGSDPRIDIAEARLRNSTGDVEGALAAARRAAELASERGARLVEADALALKARARANIGDLDNAEKLAREAKLTFDEIGDPIDAGQALTTLSLVHMRRGQITAAAEATREVVDLWRAAGVRSALKVPLSNQAHFMIELGRVDDAGRALDELDTLGREFKNEVAEGNAFVLRGMVALARGRLPEAATWFEKAIAVFDKIGDRRMHAWALARLGEQRLSEGDLKAARTLHERSLRMRTDAGLRIFVAESWLSLATLSLEEGKPAEAEGLARQATDVFREEKSSANEALGLSVLSRALLDRADRAGAREAAARAAALAGEVEPFETRLLVQIAAARVLGALDPRDGGAERRLTDALTEASSRSWVPLELEARLALAELRLRGGEAAEARRDLAALERDARAKGFGRIARKAAVRARVGP